MADDLTPDDSAALDKIMGRYGLADARVRATASQAATVAPDQYAEQIRTAQRLGVPVGWVTSNPQQAKADDTSRAVGAAASKNPVLARRYTDEDFAKLASDEPGLLTQIGEVVRNIGASGLAGLQNASAGVVGVAQAPLEVANAALPGAPLQGAVDWLTKYRQGIEAQAKANAPQVEGNLASGFYSGVQSLSSNLAALPLAVMNPAAGLTAMVAPVGGQAYGQARDQGVGVGQSAVFGLSQAAIEYATEKIPVHRLIGDVKAGTSVLKTLAHQAMAEVPGEQVATALQDLNEWATLPENKDKTFKDYLADRPDAAVQTLIATLVGTGGNVAVVHAIDKALQRASGAEAAARSAESAGELLKKTQELAAASKVADRSPEQFRSVLNEMADGAEVRFDARKLTEVLAQSGMTPEQIDAALPSVREQLTNAAASGGEVSVPVGEFIAGTRGTGLEQTLADWARVGDNELSAAEAKDVLKQTAKLSADDTERVLSQAQEQEALRAESEQVYQTVRDALDAAGRTGKSANDAYAKLHQAFFTTMAQRVGVSPMELFKQFDLKVRGETPGGENLQQSGTPVRLYHGSTEAFDKFDAGEFGFHFTPDEKVAGVFGDARAFDATINNAFYIGKDLGNWTPEDLLNWLSSREYKGPGTGIADADKKKALAAVKKLRKQHAAALADPNNNREYSKALYAVAAPVREMFKARGYDAIRYKNEGEGGEAYILFDNEQLRPAADNLQQSGVTVTDQVDDLTGLPLNSDGTVTVYHHTSKASADAITRTGRLKSAGEPDVYVTTHKDTDTGYGDTAVPIRVNPELLQLDDEFPDGRMDFRIDTGKPGGSVRVAVGEPGVLEQTTRGTFSPSTNTITLLQNADLSTFLHESGHFFLEAMSDLAARPDAPTQVREDMDKLLSWFGVKGSAPVSPLSVDAVPNRLELDAKTIGDLLVGQPLGAEANGVIRAEPFLGVFGEVARAVRDPQVLKAVVSALPVDVVNVLGSEQGAAERVLHDEAMLKNAFAVSGDGDVTIPVDKAQQLAALVRVVAGFSAEAAGVANVGGAAVEDAAAVGAGQGGHVSSGYAGQQDRSALDVWRSMTLEEKRPHHERFAESWEQYLLEGRAPSVELRPVFRRFREFLKRVYTGLKEFLAGRQNTPGGVAAGDDTLNQSVYHGTPHRGITQFSTDKIGTGEGAQAYGWGLYFASKKEIAEWYREKLTKHNPHALEFQGQKYNGLIGSDAVRFAADVQASAGLSDKARDVLAGLVMKNKGDMTAVNDDLSTLVNVEEGEPDPSPAVVEVYDWLAAVDESFNPPDGGQLYKVEIPEDSEMLLWDKPLSEQPEAVRKAFPITTGQRVVGVDGDPRWLVMNADGRGQTAFKSEKEARDYLLTQQDGASAYQTLSERLGSDKAASEALMAAGIKGIKYLDGTSRGAGDGSFNYVVFSGDDTQIQEQYYQRDQRNPLGLTDEVRGVFDRMLASDEQIAEAERMAGMLPDEDATASAQEKLTARSIRDMKWLDNARSKAMKELQAQAKEARAAMRERVTAEVDTMPEFAAKAELDKIRKETKGNPDDMQMAVVADSFGFDDVDTMLRAIDAAGSRREAIEGLTDQRMLEEHGDLVDERAMREAANEAVHNAARAKILATELAAQAAMLKAKGSSTATTLAKAARDWAAGVIDNTEVGKLKRAAWLHTQAERRAGRQWTEATAKADTQGAVQAKQDQMLQNAAARAAVEAQEEVGKILDFFKRVAKGNNEKLVKGGRDPDIANAARAVLRAYGLDTATTQAADDYLKRVKEHDPALAAVIEPMITEATKNARDIGTLKVGELRALHDDIESLWHLAKRSRQMEVDGNLIDIQEAEDDLRASIEAAGVPDRIPGEGAAITPAESAGRALQFAGALMRRVEQWAEALDGKFGGAALRLIYKPISDAAVVYKTERVQYRRELAALFDQVAPTMQRGLIEAPELGYTFGKGHNGVGMNELLHAILHTGNDSNKRKLLLGRGWATETAEGGLDTTQWDAFLNRMHAEGKLTKAHWDFAQGVWDLLEKTKVKAQAAHRDVFGRYFAEVTANPVQTPFGEYRGGYVPAQTDPRLATDNAMRKLAEEENQAMSYAFPGTSKGFTKSRVEYNKPLMLDLHTLVQHVDKVLLFSNMEPAHNDVKRLMTRKGVSTPLSRAQPAAYEGMLIPWLSRAARQTVETPVPGDGGATRVLSVIRARAGAAMMFANVSNTVQQVTGFLEAMVKVDAAHMRQAMATYIAAPKETTRRVVEASPYMAARMSEEANQLDGTIKQILLNPSLYQRAQAWGMEHAYFMQQAVDNVTGPIIWTAAYNHAIAQGQTEKDAVFYADGTIRQTQGSTAPEDVSRIESGPAYARVFTQFIGYFNRMANTNATALKQIARELGVRKGAGKSLGVIVLGTLAPIWVAEAIALMFKGGPDDENGDGSYLDDWLAATIGMGTIKGLLAQIPFVGALANSAVNRFDSNPSNDKMSMSPAVSMLEAAVGVPHDLYKAIKDPDNFSGRNAVRDIGSLVSLITGMPFINAAARSLGYAAGEAQGKVEPTGPGDRLRGLVTGAASPESQVK